MATTMVLGGIGCTKSETPPDDVIFTVDSDDLGERFINEADGFILWVPVGWIAPPDSLYEVAQGLVRDAIRRNPRRTPELLALYREPQHGGHLAIARYAASLSTAELDLLIQWHQTRLVEGEPAAQVYPTQYTYNGYHIRQLMLVAADAVTIKLFAQHPKRHVYQIDYRVPRSAYESEQPRIASSMGSLGREVLD